MRKIIVAFAATLMLTAPAAAGQSEYRRVADSQSEDATLKHWQALAEIGNADAQYNLAKLYAKMRKFAEAARWYRQAADQGNARAQYSIAIYYRLGVDGSGLARNYGEAARWFQLAADQGVADAQASLASMYFWGQGVTKNDAEYIHRMLLAADKGSEIAQSDIALRYLNGEYVPQNYIQSYKWFSVLVAYASGDYNASWATSYRNLAASKMTPSQIAEAQRLAAEWKPK